MRGADRLDQAVPLSFVVKAGAQWKSNGRIQITAHADRGSVAHYVNMREHFIKIMTALIHMIET